ncbi:hypothetical protein GF415_03455 [Candidatus Micrarchaeota archaeon]|nr:hypothetical protein [Candidatus Micrarchaeota archaeon]
MGKSEKTGILMLVVAAMAVATVGMLALLGVFLYLTPEEAEAEPAEWKYYGEETPEPEPEEENPITSERINAIAERIEGIDEINPGAKFGLYIEEKGNYTIGRGAEGIKVLEGGQEYTDFDIYLDSMETFEEIENAEDVCAKMREKRNAGNITAEIHASEIELFLKGYMAMEPCLR